MTWNRGEEDATGSAGTGASTRKSSQQAKHPIHNMQLGKVEALVTRFVAPEAADLGQYFHPATEQHLSQIVAMRQRMVDRSPEQDESYLRWRYCFSQLENTDPLAANHIWVFCKDDEVLGFIGVEAATICIHGRDARAIKVMDLMVKAEVDRRGLGVWMNLKLQSFGLPVIALGSNRNSLGIMSKLFHRMPNQQVYKSILNSANYFNRRTQNAVMARFFTCLYNLGLPLLLRSRRIKAGGRGIIMRNLPRFDASNDWDLSQMQHTGIQFRRNASYLNWRFFDIPTEKVEVLGLWEGQHLVGYLALSLRSTGPDHSRMSAFLLDWAAWSGKPYQQALLAALLDCQKRLRREGFESIAAFASSSDQHILLRRAFLHRRKDESKTVSIFVNDPFSFQALCNSSEWSLTGADTDYA